MLIVAGRVQHVAAAARYLRLSVRRQELVVLARGFFLCHVVPPAPGGALPRAVCSAVAALASQKWWKACQWCIRIPPPSKGSRTPVEPGVQFDRHGIPETYQREAFLDDGSRCLERFATPKLMMAHMQHAETSTHGQASA